MKLLVIGGTEFVGRHIVERALRRGHDVTLFNRGKTNPGLFDGVEEIHGDRGGDLDRLAGRTWDAAVDTCGYVPRIVRASADALRDSAAHYVFVSSVSAYGDLTEHGITEDSPLGRIDDPTVEEIDELTYGPLKALSENAVRDVFGKAALVLRPGLVVGPHDPTDRFTYWPHRIDRGGDVLAPAPPEAGIQFIDVRDLADFTIHAVEASVGGTFNLVTEPDEFTFGSLLETCARVAESDARFLWADPEFLLAEGVEPWMGLPLWIPASDDEFANMMQISADRAVAAGLTYRSLEDTVRDTLAWDRGRASSELKAGLPPSTESELLGAL